MRYTFLIVFLFAFSIKSVNSQANYDFEISKNLDIYYTLWKQLNTYYVDGLQPGKLSKVAIDEMLKSLDPYTNYYAEADIEDVRFLQTGRYGGVGSMIHPVNDTIVVTIPYFGFPLYNAGVRAGDKLLSIDGQSIVKKTSSDVTDILRGASGTKFTLKYLNSNNQIKEVQVERSEIEIKNVPYFGMLTENTAYIKLTGFTEKASQEVNNALDSLKKSNSVTSVILDLRDNGGGLLQQAVEIMNIFIPAGETIVTTKGKTKDQNFVYKTFKPIKEENMKVVVLVNNRSASASEIVAGAMQDLDRGVIMGQKTFGKGLVQKVYPLSYNAQVKITVAKYYVPSGRCIQAVDYEHRDKDGKAIKIADSLSTLFKTKNGRPVRDAGGIIPDVVLPENKPSLIAMDLQNQWIIFDFVTQYLATNTLNPDIQNFVVGDVIFEDFKKFVEQKKYEYKTETSKLLDKLIESAIKDSISSLAVQDLQNAKKQMLSMNQTELDKNKLEIMKLIKTEIIARFYFETGIVRSNLKEDEEVKKALNFIADEEKFKEILKGNNK